jgi:hypothetical protein
MSFQLKRRPSALSYSSFSLWESNPEEFFMRYLAGAKAPRLPQENYMSIGSAFDARVKAELHSAVFGPHADPDFEFEKLFIDQVEEHNRDWALEAGKYVLDCYKLSGSYDELLQLLLKATEPPRFESKIDATFPGGVKFSGKPDLRFMLNLTGEPLRIVLDWKVKGFCSKHGASPSPGYAMCRDGYDASKMPVTSRKTKAFPEGKPQEQSKSNGQCHDKYLAHEHRGLTINSGFMEFCKADYADQVSTYGWMLGEVPGDENVVVMIDEITGKFMGVGNKPLLRVANHKARVSKAYQLKLLERIQKCWDAVQSGHVFTDMTREESDGRCEVLELTTVGLQTDGTAEENWFNEAVRPQFNF